MTNTVKMSVFNSNKNCLIDSSVFVLNFSLLYNLDIFVGNSFFKNDISDIFFEFIKSPFVKAVRGFLKGFYSHFYSIFVFNDFNFRK